MSQGDFLSILKARARTVGGAFTEFLDSQINISRGTRSQTSTSQNSLREVLADQNSVDDTFPRILSVADADFIGGSFGRHTKNWPLDDIDIYLPIDAHGLVYTSNGLVLPYTALSDGVLDSNPILNDRDRWMDGYNVSSSKVINGFAEVLRDHYPTTTRVRRVGEAVSVTLARGLGFDVVPCFNLKPHNPFERPFYLIPDGSNGWIRTNPRIDQELSEQLHRDNEKTLRKAVKLVKWFITEFLGGRVESYFAELAVMRAFQSNNWSGRKITTVSAAAEVAFRAVRDAVVSGPKVPLIQNAPMVEPGDVTDRDVQRLNTAVDNCNLAWLYESLGRDAEAIATWGLVFGEKFPKP